MTISRARIVKRADRSVELDATISAPTPPAATGLGRRVPRAIADAHAEAARIVEDAKQRAAAILAEVRDEAEREAEQAAVARLAATFLELRRRDAERAERDLDRAVELGRLIAERLVGEGLRVEPDRIAALAASALAEARGARRVRIDACPEDQDALRAALAAVGHDAEVTVDATLERGSLVVHTDLGTIDARLRPQLARLAAALREAMR